MARNVYSAAPAPPVLRLDAEFPGESIEPDFPQSELFYRLRETERKVEAEYQQRRNEVAELFGNPVRACKTLRVWLSSAAGVRRNAKGGYETVWQLSISGRLLDIPDVSYVPPVKFAGVLERILVRVPESGTDAGFSDLEWRRPDEGSLRDHIVLTQRGDSTVNVRVQLFIDHKPKRYRLEPEAAELLGVCAPEGLGALTRSVWHYIQENDLQSRASSRIIRCNEQLRAALGCPAEIEVGEISIYLARRIREAEPVETHYVVEVPPLKEGGVQAVLEEGGIEWYHTSPEIFIDVPVDVPIPQPAAPGTILSAADLQASIDGKRAEVAKLRSELRERVARRDLFLNFSKDPVGTVESIIEMEMADNMIMKGDVSATALDDSLFSSEQAADSVLRFAQYARPR